MPVTTDAAKANAIAQYATDPFLVRLTISHATLSIPVYVVRNRKAITTTDGRTFIAYPFKISLPNSDDQQPAAKITVANVDREIGQALEAMVDPADFTIEGILSSDPDTVEFSYTNMSMTQASWNFQAVTMTIQRLGYWDQPYARKTIRPSKYPGMVP